MKRAKKAPRAISDKARAAVHVRDIRSHLAAIVKQAHYADGTDTERKAALYEIMHAVWCAEYSIKSLEEKLGIRQAENAEAPCTSQ